MKRRTFLKLLPATVAAFLGVRVAPTKCEAAVQMIGQQKSMLLTGQPTEWHKGQGYVGVQEWAKANGITILPPVKVYEHCGWVAYKFGPEA